MTNDNLDPLSGCLVGREHRFRLRVYFEDTDAAGIVYYANYLRFAERGRTEMVRGLGIRHSGMMEQGGTVFAVRHCACDYRKPARLDDLLEVRTRLVALGGASLEVEQVILRIPDKPDLAGEEIVAVANVKLVHMSLDGRPVRVAGEMRDIFQDFLNERQC